MDQTPVYSRVAASFAQQGLMQTLGAELIEVASGHCVIRAPITPSVSQQQGYAHAGMGFSLGDSAAGYAALTMMAETMEVVSVEVKMNMLRPAMGTHLIATGSVLRAGRQIVVVRADVVSEDAKGDQKLIAALQGTMMAVPSNP